MSTTFKFKDFIKLCGTLGKVGSTIKFYDNFGNNWKVHWYQDESVYEYGELHIGHMLGTLTLNEKVSYSFSNSYFSIDKSVVFFYLRGCNDPESLTDFDFHFVKTEGYTDKIRKSKNKIVVQYNENLRGGVPCQSYEEGCASELTNQDLKGVVMAVREKIENTTITIEDDRSLDVFLPKELWEEDISGKEFFDSGAWELYTNWNETVERRQFQSRKEMDFAIDDYERDHRKSNPDLYGLSDEEDF